MTDKDWATKYLLDPLNAPEPSEETGPGTHFTRDLSNNNNNNTHSNRRHEKHASVAAYPTPPSSASPSRSTFSSNNPFNSPTSYREQAFAGYDTSRRSSRPSRSHSLNERPLETIKKETKTAHRSPHMRKKYGAAADPIDALDKSFGFAYHHEGPYDATLLRRNLNPKYSPIEAVRGSNEEALRATPRENIRDALDRHMPLQGTAIIPPGEEDFSGRRMSYEEGADLMREPDADGGPYKRWPDVQYSPDDLKGKGEPSFTIEKALKKHKHKRIFSDDNSYEMQTPRPVTSSRMGAPTQAARLTRLRSQSDSDAERMQMDSRLKGMNARASAVASGSGSGSGQGGGHNSSENSHHKLEGLKRRFGSMRIGRSSGSKGTDS